MAHAVPRVTRHMPLRSRGLPEGSGLPLDALLSTILTYPRPAVERIVEGLIGWLDASDGDPDIEDDDPDSSVEDHPGGLGD